MKTTSEKVADILLSINAVSLSLSHPFTYSSGIKSPIYTDCRLLISDPRARSKIITFLKNTIQENEKRVDVIAGTATAGIPHAAWIADRLRLPMVYIRGKAKDHGKENQIEGAIKKGQRVVVIEDLISTGGSSIESVNALRKEGAVVLGVYSIMTYHMQAAQDNFKKSKTKSLSLTDFETIVLVAQQKKLIKKADIENILLWSQNPQEWGRRIGLV